MFVLAATAAFILFVIRPGGFESQIVWFFALTPGAFVAASLGDKISHVTPHLEGIIFYSVLFWGTILPYYAISYAAIKVWRLVVRRHSG